MKLKLKFQKNESCKTNDTVEFDDLRLMLDVRMCDNGWLEVTDGHRSEWLPPEDPQYQDYLWLLPGVADSLLDEETLPETGKITEEDLQNREFYLISTKPAEEASPIPGEIIFSLIERCFTPEVVEEYFSPMIADLQYEYNEAQKQGKKWTIRWLHVTYVSKICLIAVTKWSQNKYSDFLERYNWVVKPLQFLFGLGAFWGVDYFAKKLGFSENWWIVWAFLVVLLYGLAVTYAYKIQKSRNEE